MMRTKTTTWLGLILAVAMLATAPAGAQDERGEWGGAWAGGDHPRLERMHERRLERLTVVLDLNEQQVEQWEEAHAARLANRGSGRDEIRGLHEQIKEMTSSSKPDPTAIGELVIQAHQKMAAARAEREAFHAELMTILTPEQQERFEAIQEMRPERGRQGHRGRHDRRGGSHHGGPERGDR